MALRNDFYMEIFANEKRWVGLINKNLLNSIYCNLVLKPFYQEKKKELGQEYSLTGNKIIEQIIIIIENIIKQIEIFNTQYNESEEINISLILPLFLTNQMNNTNNLENSMFSIDSKQSNKPLTVLKSDTEDYLYDDFPEEVRRIK